MLKLVLAAVALALSAACGPTANIPPRPVTIPHAVAADDSALPMVRELAPTLYLSPLEWFPLERVVAVIHPTRRIIGYHLLWKDDVHGSWIPFTVPTDQEIVWVGYDSAGAATDIWTFWHGTLLHADWRGRGRPAVDVQWGKHGLLPRGTIQSDLPRLKTLNTFYAFTWLGLFDTGLGRLTRPGPVCFCRGYDAYRAFTQPVDLRQRIDAVIRTEDPDLALKAVFGEPYSGKRFWP